jgi:pseudomonalisin
MQLMAERTGPGLQPRFRFSARRVVLSTAALLLWALPPPAIAGARRLIDEGVRVVLAGNVHPLARPEFDIGRSDSALPMERMILLLKPREGGRVDLERLLAALQDPSSADFHRWLTPEEFGRRFGPSEEDLANLIEWLQGRGFTIDAVARGRLCVNFSGTATLVEEAFHTEIHDYLVDGRVRHANALDPSVPAAIARVVSGVVSLHDFPRRLPGTFSRPLINLSDGSHALAPADFATIYDVGPLYASGVTGQGQTIAVVGRTDIKLSDVQAFRSFFGLSANDPHFLHNGPDPGDLGDDGSSSGLAEENEADLDVEWAGAIAPHATIDFVISKSTSSTDGVDLSSQYAVDNDLAPILTLSFALCERDLGFSGNQFYAALWQQAAAQGMTVVAASGDSGAAGCDDPTSSRGSIPAVSGLCSTPNNVCVGGTGFLDSVQPSLYWSSSGDPTTHASALSYIPEEAWNESGLVAGGSGLFASTGGQSSLYTKPSWQHVPGVPADGQRDVPDVSLASGSHDGYIVFQRFDPATGSLYVDSGTSAATPSFGALLALAVQRTGARIGNANPTLYALAGAQYAGLGPNAFHDITEGNNSVPGVTGFSCGTGYDLATGLGSVDATVLVNAWSSASGGGRPDVSPVVTPPVVTVPGRD